MTGRARWLLLISVLGAWLGLVRYQPNLVLVSFSVFVWIIVEWVRFVVRGRLELHRIRVERFVNGAQRSNDVLWAGRMSRVEVKISGPSRLNPGLEFRDIVPENFALLISSEQPDPLAGKKGLARLWARINSGPAIQKSKVSSPQEFSLEETQNTAKFEYMVRPRSAGKVVLPAVRITMVDSYGFFRQHRTVDCKQTFSVLPDYYMSGERQSTVKRFNSLPRHGIHRLNRPGIGSELLELREYAPGDPPKSIAWKVSARRGTLMTRQYESEVPVRVNLIIDGSVSTRIGGFGLRLLDQFNYVAASVAKSALAVGDPVCASMVDENRTRRMASFSGDSGFLQFLKALSDFSDAPPPPSSWLKPQMMEFALRSLNERYPELLMRKYQVLPFSFFRSRRARYRLVAALGALFDLSAREQVECYRNDNAMAEQVRRFLHECGRPWMPPFTIIPPGGNQAAPQNMKVISQAMTRSLATAKDNEVYVVLADLLTCAPHLDQILPAVKLALAKHHRVAFVCPSSTFVRPSNEIIVPESDSIDDMLRATEQTRTRDFAEQLGRSLGRLGVPVAFSGEKSAIQMIIDEIEVSRDGRRMPQGVRA